VRKAGRKDELGYQIAKAGRELQRDCEAALLANNAAVQGTAAAAGQTASYKQLDSGEQQPGCRRGRIGGFGQRFPDRRGCNGWHAPGYG